MQKLLRLRSCFPALRHSIRTISLFKPLYNESSKGEENTAAELELVNKLKSAFPDSPHIKVDDVSGGCGSMFEVSIVSDQFKGIRTVKQHQLVNEVLKEDIQKMHGIRISTSPLP